MDIIELSMKQWQEGSQDMRNKSWINNPALENMHPRKKEIIIELIHESEGKTLQQSIPIILKAKTKLKTADLSFTQQETGLIMELLTTDMSPQEKRKVENIKNLMNFK